MIYEDPELDLSYLGIPPKPKIDPRFCKECVHRVKPNKACDYCENHSPYDQPAYFHPPYHQEDKGTYTDEEDNPICRVCASGVHLHHYRPETSERGHHDCKVIIPGGQCMCYKQCKIEPLEEGKKDVAV